MVAQIPTSSALKKSIDKTCRKLFYHYPPWQKVLVVQPLRVVELTIEARPSSQPMQLRVYKCLAALRCCTAPRPTPLPVVVTCRRHHGVLPGGGPHRTEKATGQNYQGTWEALGILVRSVTYIVALWCSANGILGCGHVSWRCYSVHAPSLREYKSDSKLSVCCCKRTVPRIWECIRNPNISFLYCPDGIL